MSLLKISHLDKQFKISDNNSVEVLKEINLTFPDVGLVGILGKSGCGKSTLLNMISMLDKPTSGTILINDTPTKRWKRKQIEKFRRNEIGVIFQNYNLLEDQDVIYNISLPLLINGYSFKEAEERAINLLDSINFSKELYHQKINKLSGGEKQRVAILRAISISPKILLCDEPTGALDSDNSFMVMSLLKKISENVLVIVVSHNQSLLTNMSDYIIRMKDGKIIEQKAVKEIGEVKLAEKSKKRSHRANWVDKIASSNFKRRLGRNIISCISLAICLTATTLVIGFIQNIDNRINEECYKHLDIGVSTISKETSSKLEDSVITLVRSSRPSKVDLASLKRDYQHYYYELNYDALVPTYVASSYENKPLEEFIYTSVYSFIDNSVNKSLLIKGHFPKEDSLLEVVINQKAYEEMKKYVSEPLNSWIDLSHRYETNYYTYDEDNTVLNDVFVYEKRAKIVGVVDELNFLSMPTIYYPYVALDEYLSSYLLNNYSEYMDVDYSWKEKIQDEIDTNYLTSYSYKLFLKNYGDYHLITSDKDKLKETFSITNNSLIVQEAFTNLISASCIGVELFLIIAIIGTILIVGLISFSSYSEDKKRSAILTCLGADLFQIIDIYVNENIMIVAISLLLSFSLLIPIKNLANYLLFQLIKIDNIVVLPSSISQNIALPYSYYLALIIASIIVVILSTFIPIVFSKRIAVNEELREE
ncbi:MAG: ATP-binding cassette domain-containing protein [Erysipelotrichaceae bacterium]|nr:ATP-binding cassette domain-containing protein [Erysipelotrichaceae bacterium]